MFFKIIYIILIILLLNQFNCSPAGNWIKIKNYGKYITIKSDYAPFPHEKRKNGMIYKNKNFTYKEHYDDNSILIFIPDKFIKKDTTDLVFYFHGWYDSIDKSATRFNLIKQFSNSNINAVFIFPETAKEAPDSFAGKFENTGGFKNFIIDILLFLKNEKIIESINPGKIILTGHSGGYRAIAYILDRGGLSANVESVYLFDGLYGELNKFLKWIRLNNRMYVISTKYGGTSNTVKTFMKLLYNNNIKYSKIYNDEIDNKILIENRIIFLFPKNLGHEDVVNPFFYLFLKSQSR